MTLLAAVASVDAQSGTSGTVTGTVRGSDLRPIGQALVALVPVGSGTAYEATTTASGSFALQRVQPGAYELRAEAIGYRPVIARLLTIGAGEERSVSLSLTPSPPPVTQVDTVVLGGAASTRWRGGGVQFGGPEVDALPHRFDDLASVAALSSAFDEALGAQGLPGDMTLILADGVPFWRAPHPTARREVVPDALFPRGALAGVNPTHNTDDAEWVGSAGGYVGLTTRTSAGTDGVEVDGAWSGTPTWSSSEMDIETPSLLSWQGGVRGVVVVSPSARLLVSGEGLSHQTPLAPRVSASLAESLGGFDAELVGSLTDPGVEQYDRYSGLLRLDVQQSRTSSLFFRGAGSFSRRAFDDAGPVSMAGAAALAEESTDFSTAFGVTTQNSRTTSLELRAGFSGSYRDFGEAITDRVPAWLSGPAVSVGGVPSTAGESSRTDFVVTPSLHWTPGPATLKFGASIRASSHAMDHSRLGYGDFVYSDAAALVAGRGFGATTSTPETSFGTQEYGVFGQYESLLAPGLRLRMGGRYDFEMIGGDAISLNTEWLETTGIQNSDVRDTFHQFGVGGSLTWDPVVDGPFRVFVNASMRDGDVDPRALAEAHADATDGTSNRYAGTGLDWPATELPSTTAPSLPSVTMLGPDMRAPRTTNLSVGVLQRLGSTANLFVRASSRRTDFLIRRRNLNVPLVPQAADPQGRSIYGTLAQDGSTVTTTTDDARRFPAFGETWALDPDGWSEYLGVTTGIEHTSTTLDLFASYTWSETTDNWVGASRGAVDATLDPGLPQSEGPEPWSEGTSDFDIPHRVAAGVTARFGSVSLSGLYRYRSGTPFTPGYRAGVDANGDGSMRNDVAFVPADASLAALLDAWPCLEDQSGGWAVRNACRGPAVHTVNARVQFTFANLAGRAASLAVDGFNLLESSDGMIDDALLLVDPSGSITTSPDGSTVTIPTLVNEGFGNVLYPSTRGRMLRVGVRIGG